MHLRLIVLVLFFIAFFSCSDQKDQQLGFLEYPSMKIGFSTQNFMKALPFTQESIKKLITYASEEGYQFIELRDNKAELSLDECKTLARVARQAGIEVIYEINVNLLHPDFQKVFEKGLANTQAFNPGILRATVASSEFEVNPNKVGWTMEELIATAIVAEQCAKVSGEKGVQLIVENILEPFIGNAPLYYGLNDLFQHTESVGLQYDLSNPFTNNSRKMADPLEVISFLRSLENRWLATHIKTCIDGVVKPVIGDSPLSVPEITELMGSLGVKYFAIEIPSAENEEACFKNHSLSLKYLKDMGIIKK